MKALAFAALCAAGAPAALAQTTTAGRIVRLVGNDTIAAPRVQVVLHRVGPSGQGPLDTMFTDPAGRFGFRFAADTASVFLLSARGDPPDSMVALGIQRVFRKPLLFEQLKIAIDAVLNP